jgi:hypothetical protein
MSRTGFSLEHFSKILEQFSRVFLDESITLAPRRHD